MSKKHHRSHQPSSRTPATPVPATTKQTANRAEVAKDHESNAELSAKRYERNSLWIQGIIAFVTTAYVVVTFFSFKTFKEAEMRSERPWVNIQALDKVRLIPNKSIQIPFVLVNGGKSPALNVIASGGTSVGKCATMSKRSRKDENFGNAVSLIGGGTFPSYTITPALSTGDIAAIGGYRLCLYITMTITYKDTLDYDHRTTICALYNSDSGGWTGCAEGNTMD